MEENSTTKDQRKEETHQKVLLKNLEELLLEYFSQ